MKGIREVVGAACIGEGGTSTGAFHEALNQAAVERLPLVVVVADNQYAYSTPTSRQFACRALTDKAVGYGVEPHNVDGNDLRDCLGVVATAVQRARAGKGPQLVVAHLLRLCGHGEHDDAGYIEDRQKNSQLGRDCLKVAEEHLQKSGWADAAVVSGWLHEAHAKVEEAVAQAQREPGPDPYKENWCALASKHLSDMYGET